MCRLKVHEKQKNTVFERINLNFTRVVAPIFISPLLLLLNKIRKELK